MTTLLLWSFFLGACYANFQFLSPNITSVQIRVGEDFNIEWEGSTGPVALVLVEAPLTKNSRILQLEVAEQQYVWKPDAGLAGGAYSIRATDSSGTYYSAPFSLTSSFIEVSKSTLIYVRALGMTSMVNEIFVAKDTDTITASPTKSSPSSAGAVTTSTSSAHRNATLPHHRPRLHRLGTGGKIAAGVGVGLGAIGLILAVLLCFRRRDTQETEVNHKDNSEDEAAGKGSNTDNTQQGMEMNTRQEHVAESDPLMARNGQQGYENPYYRN
ncbi:hypothetical protein F5884DRAFT_836931 [Xylogone sp. PMI_703]|nr:hypothetical protein F5884DRAFT_836931 [Xylogone sp. PMI_703]